MMVDYRVCGEVVVELHEDGRTENRIHLGSKSREVIHFAEHGDDLSVTAADLAAPEDSDGGEVDEEESVASSSLSAIREEIDLESAEADWVGPVPWRELLKGSRTTSKDCLLYTSPSPRDGLLSRMPSSA